ncbi:MAG: hypothetical protein ACJ8R9_27175 [Steroidobacteraceae bacterium]
MAKPSNTKSPVTRARQAASKVRGKTVKRAATIKQLSNAGGRTRAKRKQRTSGAIGSDWR